MGILPMSRRAILALPIVIFPRAGRPWDTWAELALSEVEGMPMLLCVLLAGLANEDLFVHAAKSSLTCWGGSGMNLARIVTPVETQNLASLRW